MARLRRPRPKQSQPRQSLLEKFDRFVGTRIAPLASAVKQGDIKQLGRELATNFRLQNEKLKQNRSQGTIDYALNFTPMGVTKAVPKSVIKPKTGFIETVKNFLRPAESVIERQGEAGKILKRTLNRGIDKGEIEAGKRVFQITQAKLNKLSKPERVNLFDVMEGRAKPISPKVQQAFRISRTQTDELARYARTSGVMVKRRVTLMPNDDTTRLASEVMPQQLTSLQRDRLTSGSPVKATVRVPFEPKENFFPHTQIHPDDLKGALRKDVQDNIVRLGVKPTADEAAKFIDDYKAFIETGGKQDSLIKYMVDTGQSKDAAEALSNLQRYRNKTIKRSGSLEFSRDIDLPFYDPDPARVLPRFVAEEAARIEHIRAFKQDQQIINNLILQIRDSGGDADTVRAIVDRSLGMINESRTAAAKVSRILRMVQGFKLGLAVIPNSAQGALNSLLAADLRAVAAGLFGLFRSQGRQFALRSGATLDSTLKESIRESGALSKFLKATGFTATERMNRTIAANAGKSYGTRLLQTVLKKPNNKTARRLLEDFGVNVDDVLNRKALNEDDVLMFAKKFTDITQFRSRPQDLPIFASTNGGKVFFQFKNYIYGQTRLLHRELIGELKHKNFGRALRNLLILGTVFPLTGEVIANVRSAMTGKERDTKGLARYFEDMAQVGAMGILLDTLRAGSYGKGAEFLAGPTVSDAGDLINALGQDNKARNLGKFVAKRVPIIGSRLSDNLFPTPESKPNRIRRKLR